MMNTSIGLTKSFTQAPEEIAPASSRRLSLMPDLGSHANNDEDSANSRLPGSDGKERRVQVLLAEDNPADVLLIEEAIKAYFVPVELFVVEDGEKAFEFIEEADRNPGMACPQMLLLDLNLPKRSGIEVLERVRRSARCRHIPVVILTSSDAPRDRTDAARLGANQYFRKPASYDEFLEVGQIIKDVVQRILEGIQ